MNAWTSLADKYNSDSQSVLLVKRYSLDVEITLRTKIDVTFEVTRSEAPYDNLYLRVESDDEQNALIQMETLLAAANK